MAFNGLTLNQLMAKNYSVSQLVSLGIGSNLITFLTGKHWSVGGGSLTKRIRYGVHRWCENYEFLTGEIVFCKPNNYRLPLKYKLLAARKACTLRDLAW
jgi:hypothetical protein